MAIDQPDHARRLARAIAADIALYNETQIEAGIRDGTLDQTLGEAVEEGRQLFASRVAPALMARTRFYDAALVRVLRPRLNRGAWASGLDHLRELLAAYPACAVCREPLGGDRIAYHGIVDSRWLLLLGCAACLAVTGLSVAAGSDELPAAHVEAGAGAVTRLRERLARARDAGTLEAEVYAIESDPVLGRLLGVPEVSAEAAPEAGVLRLVRDAEVVDADDWDSSPWPGPAPRLVERRGPAAGVVEQILSLPGLAAGTALGYLGRESGGWRLVAPRPTQFAERWAGVHVLRAERVVVSLETA